MKQANAARDGGTLPALNTRILPCLHEQIRADTGLPGAGRPNYGRVTEVVNLALGLLEAIPEADRAWWAPDCRPQAGETKVMSAIRATWAYRLLHAVSRLPRDQRDEAVQAMIDLSKEWGPDESPESR